MKKYYCMHMLIVLFGISIQCYAERSIFRPNKEDRWIATESEDATKKHYLHSHFLEKWAIFDRYDPTYLHNHRLPKKDIPYRSNPNKNISGKELSDHLEQLVKKVLQANSQSEFENFTILKKRDFNFQRHSGVIILKSRNYPFVIKLFIENPKSFTKPFNKGVEPALFFFMGGGCSRYLAGFTRIKNLEEIKAHIQRSPEWVDKIKTPRKWYWEPKDNTYFTVTGHNVGPNNTTIIQQFPSVYAIVCDSIDIKEVLYSAEDSPAETFDLVTFLGNRIDPHTENFVLEKGTNSIALIDTEHFPSIVGLRSELVFKNYFRWYRSLAWKFVDDRFCRNKIRRQKIQHTHTPQTLIV